MYALVGSKLFAVLLSIDLPEHFYKLTEHNMIVVLIIPNYCYYVVNIDHLARALYHIQLCIKLGN